MSGEELQLIGRSLALHPPVMIITACLFMYIRGKAIASSNPTVIINGKKFENHSNYKKLKKYIEKLI